MQQTIDVVEQVFLGHRLAGIGGLEVNEAGVCEEELADDVARPESQLERRPWVVEHRICFATSEGVVAAGTRELCEVAS